jgi:hypothetical protein
MEEKHYDEVLRRAVEDIAIIATRYGINHRHLVIVFDIGRVPAVQNEHTLTIAIRDCDISVVADGIPHEWLGVAKGFVDTRLSRRIGTLLLELDTKAQAAGRSLN